MVDSNRFAGIGIGVPSGFKASDKKALIDGLNAYGANLSDDAKIADINAAIAVLTTWDEDLITDNIKSGAEN